VPPRFLTLTIVAFWLATTGWLFYRDLWPQLRPGEPPPYAIDLADEVQDPNPIRWTVKRSGTMIGQARTKVKYRADDDTFELHGELSSSDKKKPYIELFGGPVGVKLQKLSVMYRVTRTGMLREIVTDAAAHLEGPHGLEFQLGAHMEGEVADRRFLPRGSFTWPGGRTEMPMEPVEVSATGTVLNSLHPANRINGLRPGQHWRVPVVDPLADAVGAAVAAKMKFNVSGLLSEPRVLDAEVLPAVQILHWNRQDVPCLVIVYRGNRKLSARTWVRQSDGLVLRQEAQQGQGLVQEAQQGDPLVLQRDP
jgi:hypothetical protein